MSPKEAKELLSNMFSEDGGQINGVNIRVESPISFVVSQSEDNSIFIDFPKQKPTASIKRLITISLSVKSVLLKEKHAVLEFKNFPKIPMSYEGFFGAIPLVDISSIQKEISHKYSGKKEKIANLCLFYADEWAKISSQATCFSSTSCAEKRVLRKQCIDFVTENVKKDMEQRYGSVILTYLLVFIIIPTVCKFIVYKLLEKYFD
tara:strand:+ start:803 stop:1417 length:615 start_codon:yes stop_codon:yes gene_type:complete